MNDSRELSWRWLLRERGPWLAALLALIAGVAAALFFRAQGLHLAHPDSVARALVARRIFDAHDAAMAPIGLAWLPLPAVLAAVPSISDLLYRDGIPGTIFSVAGLSLLGAALFVLGRQAVLAVDATRRPTESQDGSGADSDLTPELAGLVAAAGGICVPAMLYVAATPLVEALYVGLATAAVAAVTVGLHRAPARSGRVLAAGAACCGAAALVRYDAWPLLAWLTVTIGLLRRDWRPALRFVAIGSAFIAAFLAYATWRTGFPPHLFGKQPGMAPNPTAGSFVDSFLHYLHGAASMTGLAVPILALAGLALFVWGSRRGGALLRFTVPMLGLWGAVPIYTWMYRAGHPFRGRYALYLVPALTVGAVATVAWIRTAPQRGRALAVIVLLVVTHFAFPVYGAAFWTNPAHVIGRRYGWAAEGVERNAVIWDVAPRRWFTHDIMLFELTRDLPFTELQEIVAAEVRRHWDGGRILTSFSSCAPVVFRTGLPLSAFRGENDDGWWEALSAPPGEDPWVLGWVPDRVTRPVLSDPEAPERLEPVFELERWRLWRRR